MPDNPSQKLPDKVSAAVPDDATVVSKDLAVTKDGQIKNLETGKPVTDPKLVGTQDTPPDPLAKTDGKKFIPVEASEVKRSVQKNGGDANATDSDDSTNGSNASSPSSKVSGAADIETGKKAVSGSVHNVALENNQYGAYWGSYNGTQAFFERGGNLFAQQAKGVVDVSEHNGTIDWQAAKNAGVEGAIIRLSYGWYNRYDYQALRNISECKRLGIPFGVYIYSYAYDSNCAWGEGDDTAKKLYYAGVSPGDLSYPVFYDLENWTWTGHTPPTNPGVYDDIVNKWWSRMQQSGYNNLSVYSYTSYLNGPLNSYNIRSSTRWVASYGARTGFGFSTNDRGWQYSDNGWVNGIGNVDHNAFGNYYYSTSGMGQPAAIEFDGTPLSSLGTQVRDIREGDYRIASAYSGLYLDVNGASRSEGARLITCILNGGANQVFHIRPVGDGSYTISPTHSGLMVDASGPSFVNGTVVAQYRGNGGGNQRWRFYRNGQGRMLIESVYGGSHNKVLQIHGLNPNPLGQIDVWSADGGPNQQFSLELVDFDGTPLSSLGTQVRDIREGDYRIASAYSGLYLDVNGASRSEGARLITCILNGGANQVFHIRPVGDGSYTISPTHSGLMVDASGPSFVNGTVVAQYRGNGGGNQRWRFYRNGQGRMLIESVYGGSHNKVLQIHGLNPNPLGQIDVWSADGGPNQQFSLERL
ncbi:RICIN domain-containing protein [Bifidobacterium sp. ESL0798]|uniref:RICIN domain-containing protein n=1 Tax=Bifidobacterium sp. ESL0798 TaxID=2983235 RepID=UPI0023F73E69|nr:RICIN domain-containing protein [Bifidobacterium sp. ESL0798]WEV74934.1 RICIN domain-containing protein [Bifidobacterium sp. ESL0798]